MSNWRISLCAIVIVLLAGCQIPVGTNAALSGVGVILEPLGSSPVAPKLTLGTISQTFSLPAPSDAGPTLNRTQIIGPAGLDQVTTISQGPVGQEMKAAGDVLPATLKALHGGSSEPFPRTELGPEEE